MKRGGSMSMQDTVLSELKKLLSVEVTNRRDMIEKINIKRKALDQCIKKIGGEKYLKPQGKEIKKEAENIVQSIRMIEEAVRALTDSEGSSCEKLNRIKQLASTTSTATILKEVSHWEFALSLGNDLFCTEFNFKVPVKFSYHPVNHIYWFAEDAAILTRFVASLSTELYEIFLSRSKNCFLSRVQLEGNVPTTHPFYDIVLKNLIKNTQRKVKIHYGDSIRVTVASPNDDFNNIEKEISSFLEIALDSPIRIRYTDCSSDKVDIKSTAEWQECWTHFEDIIIAQQDRSSPVDDRLVLYVVSAAVKAEQQFRGRPATTLIPRSTPLGMVDGNDDDDVGDNGNSEVMNKISKWEVDSSLSLRTVASEATTVQIPRQRSSSTSSAGRRGVVRGRPTPGRLVSRQSAELGKNGLRLRGKGI